MSDSSSSPPLRVAVVGGGTSIPFPPFLLSISPLLFPLFMKGNLHSPSTLTGIAGLTTALAILHHIERKGAHLSLKVYEAAEKFGEIGAG